MDYERIEKDR